MCLCVCVPQVRSDRDKFTVYLDVKHFSPDELSVKVTDDYVEIQGKHGERQVELLFTVKNKVSYSVNETWSQCMQGTALFCKTYIEKVM